MIKSDEGKNEVYVEKADCNTGRAGMRKNRPLVSVICLIYNQRKYLNAMLESILSQETSYPFEVIVHDDASTDGTTELLLDFASNDSRVRPVVQSQNQYLRKDVDYIRDFILPIAHGDYLAFCEGDDYWCDKRKLQAQVDYLEENPGCSMVCGCARVIDGVSSAELGLFGYGESDRKLTAINLLEKWQIATAGTMIRRDLAIDYYSTWTFDKPVGDFPRALYMSLNGSVHYIGDCLSVYRYSVPGSWTTDVKHDKSKKVEKSIEWLRMLDEIDRVTKGEIHEGLVEHARQYALMLDVYSGNPVDCDIYKEAGKSMGIRLRLKKMALMMLELLGLQAVKVRWSGLMKWKIERSH